MPNEYCSATALASIWCSLVGSSTHTGQPWTLDPGQLIDAIAERNYTQIVDIDGGEGSVKRRQRMQTIRALTASRVALTLTGLLALFAAYGCSQQDQQSSISRSPDGAGQAGVKVETPYGVYTNLIPAELKPMLDEKDFFLVDVHIPPEGRLPKTDARIPFDQVEKQIAKFPSDKNARIVLSCRSGRMSSEASETLTKLGYTNVYNLEGGMIAWAVAGYDIVPEGK